MDNIEETLDIVEEVVEESVEETPVAEDGIEERAFQTFTLDDIELRAVNDEERIVEGIAVPYNQTVSIGGKFNERFAQDSVTVDTKQVHLYYNHDHSLPIGQVLEGRSEKDGYIVRARISQTSLGNDVYELVKDGSIRKFSIGFEPVEHNVESGNTVVRTKVALREVSLVPQPAYEGAEVLSVRSDAEEVNIDQNTHKENVNMENTNTNIELDVADVRSSVENLERKFELLANKAEAPVLDTRSAGEVLKAIATGKEEYRAYAGGTTADAVVMNGWVGDLTRIVDEAAVLRSVFARQALPAEGNYVEYGVLKANGIDVDVQAAEGDDLAFGLIEVESKTAAVKTFGGYTTLSRQEIERASVNMLDHALRGMAVATGKALNANFRSAYGTEVAAQVTAGNTVTLGGATYGDWLDAIIDGSVKFETLGLTMDGLIVDKATFKALMALEAADGRPVFNVTGAGVNNIGNLDVRALSGAIANIPVILDSGLGANKVAFFNRGAITEFGSPVVSLQDDNIINLSRDFSVYSYAAVGTTISGAIVPVVTA